MKQDFSEFNDMSLENKILLLSKKQVSNRAINITFEYMYLKLIFKQKILYIYTNSNLLVEIPYIKIK